MSARSLRSLAARQNQAIGGAIVQPGFTGPAPRTCQFIAGDPKRDATKCGADALPGRPYCGEHAARCYRKPGAEDEA